MLRFRLFCTPLSFSPIAGPWAAPGAWLLCVLLRCAWACRHVLETPLLSPRAHTGGRTCWIAWERRVPFSGGTAVPFCTATGPFRIPIGRARASRPSPSSPAPATVCLFKILLVAIPEAVKHRRVLSPHPSKSCNSSLSILRSSSH